MASLPARNTCLISEGLTRSVKLAFTTGENAPESQDSHVLQPTHLCLLFLPRPLPPTTPSLPSCSIISSLRTMQTEGLGEPIPDVMGSLHRISRTPISSTVMGLSNRGGCHLGAPSFLPGTVTQCWFHIQSFLDWVPAERGFEYLTECLLTPLKLLLLLKQSRAGRYNRSTYARGIVHSSQAEQRLLLCLKPA